jgi:hypothetical protein
VKELANYVANVLIAMVCGVWTVVMALLGSPVIWHISGQKGELEIPCPTCGQNVGHAIGESTHTGHQE